MDFENAQLQRGRLEAALLIEMAYWFLLEYTKARAIHAGFLVTLRVIRLSAASRSILAQRCLVGGGIFIKRNLITLDLAV